MDTASVGSGGLHYLCTVVLTLFVCRMHMYAVDNHGPRRWFYICVCVCVCVLAAHWQTAIDWLSNSSGNEYMAESLPSDNVNNRLSLNHGGL